MRISVQVGGGAGTILGGSQTPGVYRVEVDWGEVARINESWLTLEDEPTPALRKLVQDHRPDIVSHPAHYTSLGVKCKGCGHDIECIDVVEHMNFNLGNVVKYAWRVDDKDEPIENLRKARQYLDFEIARREREK